MYIKEILDNGIRVVMENIPYVNSISVGVFVNTGTKDESKDINGISHFIEHMVFKGTEKRTAKEIAEAIDNVGGQMNAFTGSEYTCFYIKVLDKHLQIAIDILSDMINNPKFSEEDIENEKKVVLEEIKMYLDSPEDIVFDMLHEIMFKDTPLSFPILGTEDTVSNINRKTLLDYYHNHYTSDNMVISVVGNFEYKEMMSILNHYFCRNSSLKSKAAKKAYYLPRLEQGIISKQREFEQVSFCLGMEGIRRDSDDLYPLHLINNTFGGSMSSILFQKIREEKGLAYSVYSAPVSFQESGIFTIYAALGQEEILNVAKLISDEIDVFKEKLMSKSELAKSKEQLKSNYILGMESTFNRMLEIGKSELLLNEILTPEDVLKKIDKVNMDDIERVARKVLDRNKFNIAYIGNIQDSAFINDRLKEIFFN